MSVKNYKPEFFEFFRQASEGEVTVKLRTAANAERLRFRMHNLRKDMRKESHHMLLIAEGCTFTVKPLDPLHAERDDPHILIGKPVDNEFTDELHAAGIIIKAPELPPVALPPVGEVQSPPEARAIDPVLREDQPKPGAFDKFMGNTEE